ncbi:hypothetical protein Ahy_A04g017238 isoform A [Arachis hypogaea]|uniref:OTU domain-containing protein n=1 Tax=Arachis hypogaea TaxID=3818 RepID=A0A445DAF7_ARAHY|nr:hypothetical protein Ahy_A04g017238 isoform A [Arachis hypogaea]
MGKLLCDSTTVAAEPFQGSPSAALPWRDQKSTAPMDAIGTVDLVAPTNVAAVGGVGGGWEDVIGLEDQQRRHLQRLHAKGVLWKPPPEDEEDDDDSSSSSSSSPSSSSLRSVVFRLSHGGEVSSDGNCLFTASRKAMLGGDDDGGFDVRELRRRTVAREMAAESIYKERCIPVNDGPSWAKYMLISGSADDEYDIITLQYTEEGLLSVDENREGHAAAFGDDIAIECLATEFKREIYVVRKIWGAFGLIFHRDVAMFDCDLISLLNDPYNGVFVEILISYFPTFVIVYLLHAPDIVQAHGSDAMVDEENCVFFLPHRPRSQITELPFFLFMKGTGWCGAGADHYEPLIAHPSAFVSQEKVAVVL